MKEFCWQISVARKDGVRKLKKLAHIYSSIWLKKSALISQKYSFMPMAEYEDEREQNNGVERGR